MAARPNERITAVSAAWQGDNMRKLFGNPLSDAVGQDSSSGSHDFGFDISSFMGAASPWPNSQQGLDSSSPYRSTSGAGPLESGWSTSSSSISSNLGPVDSNEGSTSFGLSPATSSFDVSSASQRDNGRGSSDLGQLMLLDTDLGLISPFQSTTTSGSTSSTTSTTSGSTPAPTLVGVVGGFQINLIWDSSVASAPVAFQKAAITAAYRYSQLFSN